MVTTLGLIALLGLILANGYFVAAEFAYVATRRHRLEELAESGDRRARRAIGITQRLSFMLSGAQLGITATSLLAGFIAEPTLGAALGPLLSRIGVPATAVSEVSLTLAFLVATGAQMVLGELAPKNLAIARPEPLARGLAGLTQAYLAVAGPLIRLFDGAANRLLRSLGIEPVEELAQGVSPEELERIIAASSAEGELTDSQARLLARVLDFRDLRAGDVMVPRPSVVAVAADAQGRDLRELARRSGHSRFPVIVEGLDDVLGVVQAKELLAIPVDQRDATPVRRLLQPPVVVPESARLGPVLAALRRERRSLALVIDEYGGTAGILTIEDVVEELVGSIQDEYDPAEPSAQRLIGGDYLVPGSWRIDEVERDCGLALPEGEWDTVTGLVMSLLGRVPAPGDSVLTDAALVRVETMRGMAVGLARLVPLRGEEVE